MDGLCGVGRCVVLLFMWDGCWGHGTLVASDMRRHAGEIQGAKPVCRVLGYRSLAYQLRRRGPAPRGMPIVLSSCQLNERHPRAAPGRGVAFHCWHDDAPFKRHMRLAGLRTNAALLRWHLYTYPRVAPPLCHKLEARPAAAAHSALGRGVKSSCLSVSTPRLKRRRAHAALESQMHLSLGCAVSTWG